MFTSRDISDDVGRDLERHDTCNVTVSRRPSGMLGQRGRFSAKFWQMCTRFFLLGICWKIRWHFPLSGIQLARGTRQWEEHPANSTERHGLSTSPEAYFTNNFSAIIQIRRKLLPSKFHWCDRYEILYMTRQLYCRGMCNILQRYDTFTAELH